MLIEEAVYQLLSNDNPIKAIVGESVYPVTIPQLKKGETNYPALIMTMDSRDREQTHRGPEKLVKTHLVVSCLGQNYFDSPSVGKYGVKQLANNVRLALNGKSTALAAIYGSLVRGIFLTSETDDYVFDPIEELSLYHVPMSFTIQHWEELDE